MKEIVQELERQLTQLDPPVAAQVERLVRDALALADGSAARPGSGGSPANWPANWPDGYFARTAGALAGEKLERPQQSDLPEREAW